MEDKQVSGVAFSEVNVDGSCLGSVVGSRTHSSHSRSSNSKATLILAKLREQQLVKRLDLEHKLKLQEARDEVEMAELRAALSDEENLENVAPIDVMKPEKTETLNRFLDDCKIASIPRKEHTEYNAHARVNLKIDLPKVEMMSFDGSIREYWKFIRQFEFYVEKPIEDSGQRLLYLINYCSGMAKEAISDCIMLPPTEGYVKARHILNELFGQPHLVARSMIDSLVEIPKLSPNDSEGLTKLAMRMQSCEIALQQMHYSSDLNSLHTLEMIVLKLPRILKDKWSRDVDAIYASSREPSFKDLSAFIRNEARVSRSRFGRLAMADSTRQGPQNENALRQKIGHKSEIYLATGGPMSERDEVKCPECGANHQLEVCKNYLDLSVGLRWTKIKGLNRCYACLGFNHQAKNCRKRVNCSVAGCKRSHHTTLHTNADHQTRESTHESICANTSGSHSAISLGVVPVIAKGPRGEVRTYALLDNGSDTTLITQRLMNELGITGKPSRLQIKTVTAETVTESYECDLSLDSIDRIESLRIKGAHTVEGFPIKIQATNPNKLATRWPHLNDVCFPEAEDGEVTILIGCDVPEAHWALDQRLGARKQPFAVKTLFGWVMRGPTTEANGQVNVGCTMVESASVWDNLSALYNHEFCDLDVKQEYSGEEKRALDIVDRSTRYVDGQFEVPLPWKSPNIGLTNNLAHALSRLVQLRRRFQRNEELFRHYDAVIRNHLLKGYAVPISESNQTEKATLAWYLPHHPVLNPKKPNKVRIVFDCAAKFKGSSLNDCLLQGPDTTANLIGILLRFRRYEVALTADIEEMFLQVKVPESDREYLRFLWWADGRLNDDPKHYQLTVHPFGATSSPFCANYALKRAIMDFGQQLDDVSKVTAMRDIYVDDCITSMKKVKQAVEFVGNITSVFKTAGFRLRKWMSNCREVLQTIPDSELVESVVELKGNSLPIERTLGIEWNTETDMFQFTFRGRSEPKTRRNILACTAALYDPLGLVAPLILPAKMLLQDLCREGLHWDEPLNKRDAGRWEEWLESMSRLNTICVPRCVKSAHAYGDAGGQLHLFSDASEKGYGAVAYVRYAIGDNEFDSTIVMAKARVAPLKSVTIPRLELTAAVLAVRLLSYISREMDLEFDKIYLWTDSIIVLRYIANQSTRFSTFVANRLTIIHESTKPSQWKHISTKYNPADLASRGITSRNANMQVWIKGPEFLRKPENDWPKETIYVEEPDAQFELKKCSVNNIVVQNDENIDAILSYYSDWLKLSRAVAWWRRYITYLRIMRGKNLQLDVGTLKVEELESAQLTVCRIVQVKCFSADYASIKINGICNKNSNLRRLCPIMIDDVIRVGGRLQLSGQCETFKHPIILPKDHAITVAIIRYYHELEGHSGVSHVLAAIRQRYWIVNGGATVKRVIGRCIACRRRNAAAGMQQMASLPVVRIQEGWYPFKYVGVDYFGPFLVRRGRSDEKRYGCLFNCMQCRAVHIEVTHSLSTDSFILALVRFISRWSQPLEIYSDNGTNFVGANNELRQEMMNWSQREIIDHMANQGIKWVFNPPAASHRGGVWERMIRSIRRVLSGIIESQVMTDETLLTYMARVERIVNNRPLVPLRDDPNDPKPLRPSDLLSPRGDHVALIGSNLESIYVKRWRFVNHLTSVFWKRWIKEYLPTLQQRQKWHRRYREFHIGDLVLVTSESTPRECWPLGIIEATEKSDDGLTRTVTVRTARASLRRDIRKICLLEGVGELDNVERNCD